MVQQSRLSIPHRVYGRKNETASIQSAVLGKDDQGPKAIFLSGESGIGKTATIKCAINSLPEKEISFLSGKFDQLAGDTLGGAFLKAISTFLVDIIAGPYDELQRWKEELREHLGQNARVLGDVIPELQIILGEMEAPAELGPAESQVRFELMLVGLVVLISIRSPKHIVMFIDDLQWASARSINLIKNLIRSKKLKNFLFIGAYRDNVAADHPVHMLSKIEDVGIKNYHLGPLKREDIDDFLTDTLGRNDFNKQLSQNLVDKTAGNPFHIIQFLFYIELQGILFKEGDGWNCDMEELKKQSVSDNVVDILLSKMKTLGEKEQRFLSICSILGNEIDLNILTDISAGQGLNFNAYLTKMRYYSYLNISKKRLSFSHDRIQEAAYKLIDQSERKKLHKVIGDYLLEKKGHKNNFDATVIADHLNFCVDLLERKEKIGLIHLNVEASGIAKKSTAFAQSLVYLNQADEMKSLVEDDRELYSKIILERAESLYLNGDYVNCEKYINQSLQENLNASSQALLLNQLIIQCTAQGRYADAIENGRKALAKLDMSLPQENLKKYVLEELDTVKGMIHGRDVLSLRSEDEMQDQRMKIAMNILINMDSPCYLSNIDLYCVVVAKMVQISIEYGPVPESAKGYASYGIVLCSFNENKLGREFNELGIAIADRFNHLGQICRACHTMANHVQFWTQHIIEGDSYNDRGFLAGHDAGEYLWAGFIKLFKPYNQFFRARNIHQLKDDIVTGLDYCTQHPNQLGIDTLTGLGILLSELAGSDLFEGVLSLPTHEQFVKKCHETNSLMALSMYLSVKTFTLLLENKFEEASVMVENSLELLPFSYSVITNFYDTFSKAFLLLQRAKSYQEVDEVELSDCLTSIEKLAISCPENFEAFHNLLLGELNILKGDFYPGVEFLEKASDRSRKSGFDHLQGLIWNRLSFHWQNTQGKSEISSFYKENAEKVFKGWGANELAFKSQRERGVKPEANDESKVYLPSDLSTILKGHSIGGERLGREEILNKSLSVLVKASHSQYGAIYLLDNESNLILEESLNESWEKDLSSLVNYTFRANKTLCSHLMEQERIIEILGDMNYSILSTPIQGKGVIVLIRDEKNTDNYNEEVMRVVQLITQQLLLSLENIDMYQKMTLFNKELEEKVALRTRELKNERDKAQAIAEDLKKAQREIVDIAKNAGRTEVAANVLHNVGNSSMFILGQFSIMRKKLKKEGPFEILQALITKLGDYQGGVVEFVKKDPVGQNLGQFLQEIANLGHQFIADQDQRVAGIEQKLRQMMKLIKTESINYNAYAVLETTDIRAIIDEAVILSGLGDTIEHRVRIETPLQPKLDFAKVKNILINLYSNSINACANLDRKPLVTSLVKKKDNYLRIEVSDNGCGIAEAALSEIFSPGVSTRNNGEGGYGLHNSSIVAQNLGGSLIAHSDGPQMGATFILELPWVS